MDFTNKVVLVTGASAGIGEATAILFAKHGAKLSLVGRNVDNLLVVADRCELESGEKPLAIVADLATDEGCKKTAKETIEHFGRLDILVNNAGVSCRSTILNADMDTFDRVFNTNIRGVYNLTRLLVPELIKSKGNIVNVSSIAGTLVSVGSLPYAMSKAALDHFTRVVALELAPKGVRVNTVSPGVTVSKILTRMTNMSEEGYKEFLTKCEQIIPMGKVCQGEHIAKMIMNLASDDSALVSGTVVQVDGCMQYAGVGTTYYSLKE